MNLKPEVLETIAALRFVNGVGNPEEKGTACVMSAAAAAWRLERGEPMGEATDKLACVCPVVRALAIRRNDGHWESKEARKRWALALIPRIIGSRGSRELTERRAFLCADRSVRVFAVAHLRRRGMEEQAASLEALPTIVDRSTAAYAADAARAYAADAARAYAADAARAAAARAADARAYAAADAVAAVDAVDAVDAADAVEKLLEDVLAIS